MANTYSQMYVHIVFSTRNRDPVLHKQFRKEIYQYISGIIKNRGQKSLAINGTCDHIHLFIGLKPDMRVSDLVRDIKHYSTLFINQKNFLNHKFYWQTGFGSFTYSQSQISSVINYIQNQESHHKVKSFKEEYMEFLNKYKVEYNPQYIFD